MEISRTTVTEIYESARYKIADSLIHGKTLLISGGHYRLCQGDTSSHCFTRCTSAYDSVATSIIEKKGNRTMRIAATYENGMIFQHFGHTETFKLYDIENGQITGTQIVSTNGQGHGALSGFLSQAQVDILICGGIGGDEAVTAYLADELNYNPNVQCSHHSHDHSCGEHHCGENKHGCSGNH